MNILKASIILSLLFHAAILSYSPSKPKKPKPKPKRHKIKLGGAGKDKTRISAMIGSNTPCPDYYIGIGLTQSFFGEIDYVAPGGPAYRAGIKSGDLLMTRINNSQLKEGQVIEVSCSRDGIIKTYSIKVERICKNEDS
jgi:predicted metalloprotease with PDZ domain